MSASTKKRLSDFTTVNCERAARGVWLVKVPKYLSEIWQNNKGETIGSLITGNQVLFRSNMALKTAEKQENIVSLKFSSTAVFNLFDLQQKKAEMQPTTSKYAPSLDDLKPLGKKTQAAPTIPAEHSFLIKDLADQTMAVLAEDKSHFAEDAQLRTGKLFVEGRVCLRFSLVICGYKKCFI